MPGRRRTTTRPHNSTATRPWARQRALRTILSRKNILQVVSLGPAVRAEQPLRGLFVPGEVEYEENGQKAVMHLRTQVSQYSKGRWRIRNIGMGP